jgi:glycosyltransferase involved in cell wall biosynthesis
MNHPHCTPVQDPHRPALPLQSDTGIAPRISVVMAVYNGERFLREAIESILGQTFANFEFLIIDDGSTDRTRKIIRSYEDPRIRLVVNETNEGLTRTLNSGLRLARGEFIARQDADDISEPERFEKQIAFMDANTEVALLGTQYRYMDETGVSWGTEPLPCSHGELSWALLFGTPFIHSAVMFRRRQVLDSIGEYDQSTSHAQDYQYWNRIALTHRVANLEQCLVRYRCHSGSMTAAPHNSTLRPLDLLRATLIGRMLGWDPAAIPCYAAHGEAMASLMLGWADAVEVSQAERAAADILQLLDVFCRERRLRPEEMERLTITVRNQLSTRLALIAASHTVRRPRVAWRLWRLAALIDPRSALKPRVMRKCLGRVATSVGLHVRLPELQSRTNAE